MYGFNRNGCRRGQGVRTTSSALSGGGRSRWAHRRRGHRVRPGVPASLQRQEPLCQARCGQVHIREGGGRVGTCYFYVLEAQFGPGFIKVCTYFLYPAKVWLNGHEWAQRQARREGITFRELANGLAACEDPIALRVICDRFGPGDVQGFFDRWTRAVPTPFTDDDREAGHFGELSMRQVGVSRTQPFDDPRPARSFFES